MRWNRPVMSWRSSEFICIPPMGARRRTYRVAMTASQWPMLIVFTRAAGKARTKSEQCTPGRHRPQAFHARLPRAHAAHADVPIVQVDCRVAVAGNEQHLVAAPRPHRAGGRVDD